jgi:succinate dehydrogenase / fumarate reductase cytochrome b subunit
VAAQHGAVDFPPGDRYRAGRRHLAADLVADAAATSDEAFATVQWFLGTPIGLLLLVAWSASLIFHLLSGIRHLFWDAGFGFEKPHYNQSGWAVVGGTVIGTVVVWAVGLAVW